MEIPWLIDEGGRGKFGELTIEQKHFLLCDLKIEDDDNQETAFRDLELILTDYQNWLHYQSAAGKPGDEPKRIAKASKAFTKAIEAVNALGPDSFMLFFDEDNEEYPINLIDVLAGLKFWQGQFEQECTSFKVAKGPPKNIALEFTIRNLSRLYEKTTGNSPGVSHSPIEKAPGGKQEIYGPFVRFCRNAITVVTCSPICPHS